MPQERICQRSYRVSNSGNCIVGLYARCSHFPPTITHERNWKDKKELNQSSKVEVDLKAVNISGLGDPFQSIHLEYSDPDLSSFHDHSFTFSPDLSILQVGPQIFDLLTPLAPSFSFPDSPLGGLGNRRYISNLSFSSCNRFMLVITRRNKGIDDGSSKIGIFRISRANREIDVVSIQRINDLVAEYCFVAFNPIFPLFIVIYTTKEVDRDSQPIFKALEVDPEASRCVQIEIPLQILSGRKR